MPKLNKATAAKVDESSGGSFEPVEEGIYEAKLVKVTVEEGPKGPYWKWEYDLIGDGVNGRKQFNNTSLSEAALWKVKETFDAFGEPTDTDTDELIGKKCRLQVSQQVILKGAREGEMGNNVDKVLPFEPTGDEGDVDPDEIPF